MNKYEILGEIGKGSFGTVFKASQTKINTDFAIKKVRCDAPENVELALQEFWTLSSLGQHGNIIRFEECYLQHGEDIRRMKHGDKNSSAYLHLVEMAIKGKRGQDQAHYYLWFVMEFCDCGDMNDYILARDPIACLNAMFMIQLADGISFLHKSNVVHRDLKPENVLIRSTKEGEPLLKIADFGLSKVCTRPIKEDVLSGQGDEQNDFNVDTCWLSSACGSDFFMAPEVFQGRYTAKADVFAMGIIFWAIMDRITFIDAGTKKVLLGTYVRREKEVLPVGEALLDDPNLNMAQLLIDTGHGPVSGQRHKRSQTRTCITGNKSKLRDLIAQMVHPNPDFRPSSQELLGKLGVILQLNKRPMSIKTEINMKSKLVASSHRRSRRGEKDVKMKVEEKATPNEQTSTSTTRSKTNLATKVNNQRVSHTKTILIKEENDKYIPDDIEENLEIQISSKVSDGIKRHTSTMKTRRKSGAINCNKKAVISEVTTPRRSLRQLRKKQIANNDEGGFTECGKSSRTVCDVSDKAIIVKTSTVPKEEETSKKGTNIQNKNSCKTNLRAIETPKENKSNLVIINADISESKPVSGTSLILDRRKPSATSDSLSRSSALSKDQVPVWDSAVNDTPSNDAEMIGNGLACKVSAKTLAVGNAVEKTKDEEQSNDDSRKLKQTFSPPLVGDARDIKPTVEITGFRRRIGLKAQICKCKPKSPSISENEDEMPYAPKESPKEDAAKHALSVGYIPQEKPKFEVPCSPCVVEQSAAKGFRHNPFYTAVKKRWRYVVLEETTVDSNKKEKESKHADSKTHVHDSTTNKTREIDEKQKHPSVAENCDGDNNRNTQKLPKKEIDKSQNTARYERFPKTRKLVDDFNKKVSSKNDRSLIPSRMESTEHISSVSAPTIAEQFPRNKHVNKRLVSHSIGRILSPESDKTHNTVSFRDTPSMTAQNSVGCQKLPHMNRLKLESNGKESLKNTIVSEEFGYVKDTIVPKNFLPHLVNFWNPSSGMNVERHVPSPVFSRKITPMSDKRKMSERSKAMKKAPSWDREISNKNVQIPTIDLTIDDDEEEDIVYKEYRASRKRKTVESNRDCPPQKLRRGELGIPHRPQLRGRPRISVTSPQARSSVIEFSPPKTRISDVTQSPLLSPRNTSFQSEPTKEIQEQYRHRLNHSSPVNERRQCNMQSPLRSNERYPRNIQASPLLHSPLLSPVQASPSSYSSRFSTKSVLSSNDSRHLSPNISSSPDKRYLSAQRALRSTDPLSYQLFVAPNVRSDIYCEKADADLSLRSPYFRNPSNLQIPVMMNLLQPGNLVGGRTGSYVYKQHPPHNSSLVHDPHFHLGADLNNISPLNNVPCKNSLCASCVHDKQMHARSQKRSAEFQTTSGQLQRALTSPLYPSLPFVGDLTGISLRHYSQQQQNSGIFSKYPFIPSVQNPS